MELLAPAQNLIIAKSAITYGADAVYIGASSFSARKSAHNSLSDIETLINFAHKYNAKIYITLNTILDDKEIFKARDLIYKLCNIGADALIIQDMGLLELDLPDIELHASTQCNIRTLEKVKFFEKIGIKRAILARELSIEQIENIAKNTNIELETFIHGALCVSYSGQCYMSAFLGGRSANRGECAQACRKKYFLKNVDNKILCEGHLLSLKDFCAEKYLERLVRAGVESFKIEGRLKDETYVKNTVLYYRKLLDKIGQKSSDGEILADFTPNINKVFNRGYTTYFLGGRGDEIHNFETPKSKGEFIGFVKSISKNYFEIDRKVEISAQDGLCFAQKKGLVGCLVNKAEGGKIFPNKKLNLKAGDKIFRNQDVKFENLVKNSRTKRVIKVKVEISKDKIKVSDGKFEVISLFEGNGTAQNQDRIRENFIKSFQKSGGSIFLAEEILFPPDKLPFLPLSKINEIRREIFSNLENLRLKNYKVRHFKKTAHAEFINGAKDYRLNIYNNFAQTFYQKCKVQNIEFAPEKTGNFSGVELMRTKYCIRYALNICLKSNQKHERLFLEDETGMAFSLKFDCKNCEMAVLIGRKFK